MNVRYLFLIRISSHSLDSMNDFIRFERLMSIDIDKDHQNKINHTFLIQISFK